MVPPLPVEYACLVGLSNFIHVILFAYPMFYARIHLLLCSPANGSQPIAQYAPSEKFARSGVSCSTYSCVCQSSRHRSIGGSYLTHVLRCEEVSVSQTLRRQSGSTYTTARAIQPSSHPACLPLEVEENYVCGPPTQQRNGFRRGAFNSCRGGDPFQ